MRLPDDHPLEIERNWRQHLIWWLWLGVGIAALEAIVGLVLLQGLWRVLAVVPVLYGTGALICAIELREIEHPSRARWLTSLAFAAWPVVVIIGGAFNRLTGVE